MCIACALLLCLIHFFLWSIRLYALSLPVISSIWFPAMVGRSFMKNPQLTLSPMGKN